MRLEDLTPILAAIGNHEEEYGQAVSPVSAAVILADKSDVHRSRVRKSGQPDFDIHDRVNYAAEQSFLRVDSGARTVTLELTIDTEISQVMEYFEIFLHRMVMCRRAAETARLPVQDHCERGDVAVKGTGGWGCPSSSSVVLVLALADRVRHRVEAAARPRPQGRPVGDAAGPVARHEGRHAADRRPASGSASTPWASPSPTSRCSGATSIQVQLPGVGSPGTVKQQGNQWCAYTLRRASSSAATRPRRRPRPRRSRRARAHAQDRSGRPPGSRSARSSSRSTQPATRPKDGTKYE